MFAVLAMAPLETASAQQTRLEFFENSSAGEAAHLLSARREEDARNSTDRWVRLKDGQVFAVRGEFVLAFNNRKAYDRPVGLAMIKVFRKFANPRQPTETRLILRNQDPQAWQFPLCGPRRVRYFEPIRGPRHFSYFTGLSRKLLDDANVRCAYPYRYFQAVPFGASDLQLLNYLEWITEVPKAVRQRPDGWGREVHAHSYRIYANNRGRGMPYPYIGIQSFGATEALVEIYTSSGYSREVTVRFQ
ncbi:MAG TPA: hypothetical protein VFZ91_07900 [Allosphingosinicella sp.]